MRFKIIKDDKGADLYLFSENDAEQSQLESIVVNLKDREVDHVVHRQWTIESLQIRLKQ